MPYHQPRSACRKSRSATRALLLGLLGVWTGLGASVLMPDTAVAQETDLGKEVYKEANCMGCHKWHGGGGGGYGGAALSLRETMLDPDQIAEVVRCGRPATRMPYHDRNAYKKDPCYGGLTKSDLGADFPAKAAHFLRPEQIEAVVVYVTTHLQGHGAPTKEDCVAFWGADAKQCASMK
jgi:mono/diheme cytochrome c family protein